MPYQVIHVGTGGFGKRWCEEFLPQATAAGLINVVAAVDIDPEALANAGPGLGLRPDKCYTDIQQAFAENSADVCTVVVPPAYHEQVVDVALANECHILSEKPIADTLPAAVRVANKVKQAGRKMGITMSHRFSQDKTTLRQAVKSAHYGPVDYVMCSMTCELRKFPTWGKFRYQAPDIMITEAGAHRLDMIADLAGARCRTVYTQAWNPPWSEFQGNIQAMVMMQFENQTRGFWEGSGANAVGLHPWANEYWRVECQEATLVLHDDKVQCFPYQADKYGATARDGEGAVLPLLEQPEWGHVWLIRQFVEWLDGGPPMATNVWENLYSAAIGAAAIESSRTGLPVDVLALLERVNK
jgi:predicted dehydrogenase